MCRYIAGSAGGHGFADRPIIARRRDVPRCPTSPACGHLSGAPIRRKSTSNSVGGLLLDRSVVENKADREAERHDSEHLDRECDGDAPRTLSIVVKMALKALESIPCDHPCGCLIVIGPPTVNSLLETFDVGRAVPHGSVRRNAEGAGDREKDNRDDERPVCVCREVRFLDLD